jgi:hypothetical protein
MVDFKSVLRELQDSLLNVGGQAVPIVVLVVPRGRGVLCGAALGSDCAMMPCSPSLCVRQCACCRAVWCCHDLAWRWERHIHKAESRPIVAAKNGQNGECLLVVWHAGASEEGVDVLVAQHGGSGGRADERDSVGTRYLREMDLLITENIEQTRADKTRHKQRRADKSRQDQIRPDKSSQGQTRADKSRQKQPRADKSRQKQTRADKSERRPVRWACWLQRTWSQLWHDIGERCRWRRQCPAKGSW